MNHHDLLDSHDLRVSTPQQVCDQKTIPRCHFPSHTRRWQLGAVVCQFGDMRIDETSEKMQDWGSDFLKEVSKEVFLWKYKDPMSPFIGYTYIYICVYSVVSKLFCLWRELIRVDSDYFSNWSMSRSLVPWFSRSILGTLQLQAGAFARNNVVAERFT